MSNEGKLDAEIPVMVEFDRSAERHFPLMVVKAVDSGRTVELQIEDAISGKVVRVPISGDLKQDEVAMVGAVTAAFRNIILEVWNHVRVPLTEDEATAWGDSQVYEFICVSCAMASTAPDPNVKRARAKLCMKCYEAKLREDMARERYYQGKGDEHGER